jgi:hypothetical protein
MIFGTKGTRGRNYFNNGRAAGFISAGTSPARRRIGFLKSFLRKRDPPVDAQPLNELDRSPTTDSPDST